MAVAIRPLIDGLRPAPASWLLLPLRWLLLLLAFLPPWLAARGGLASGAALRPYFTDVEGRLPVVQGLRLLDALPDAFGPVVAATLLVTTLLSEGLTAGALVLLSPSRPTTRGRTALAELRSAAHRYLPAFLRLLVVQLIVLGLGWLALGRVSEALVDRAELEGWTGYTRLAVLPAVKVLLGVTWLALVGAWGHWTRVLLVVRNDRRVLRAALAALRVWLHHPGRAPLFHVVVTLTAALALGAALTAWRQSPPPTTTAAWLRVAGFALLLAGHAWVWHWLVRAARLLAYSTGGGALAGTILRKTSRGQRSTPSTISRS